MDGLSQDQLDRYRRNILLPGIGPKGQRKLLASRVLVVGAGGLGSAVLYYLAAAGIGHIGVIDADNVELSNLQRQILYAESDLGEKKVAAAARRLQALNQDVHVEVWPYTFSADNGTELIKKYDFIVEATDNFAAKFLVNDICVAQRTPFSHGGILQYFGQTMTIVPGKSCCYRCVFGEEPPGETARQCSQAGVFGAVAGIIGSLQATETLKFLTGVGSLLQDALLTIDAKDMRFRTIQLQGKKRCPVCQSLTS